MDDLVRFGIGLAAIVFVALLGRLPYRQIRLRLQLRRVPRTNIASVGHDQIVKVVGRVQLGSPPLLSPLTGQRCACFTLSVFEMGSENGGQLVDESDAVPFLLQDESGTILVDPTLFQVVSGAATVCETRKAQEPLAQLDRYLEKAADRGKHQGALGLLRRRWPLRIEETVVLDGSTIAVHGVVTRKGRGDADTGSTERVLTSPDGAWLLVSSHPWTLN